MRALELVKHCWCALKCIISTQKTKNVENHPELANVRCFPIAQDSEKKYYAAEMPERERRMRWIATCRLDSLNVTRHTRIRSIYFEGGLGPTKLNPVPSIFAFRQHHWWKPPKSSTDPEERRRKQWKQTPQTSTSRKVFTSRKKQQHVNSAIPSKEEYSALEGANTPYCRPV